LRVKLSGGKLGQKLLNAFWMHPLQKKCVKVKEV